MTTNQPPTDRNSQGKKGKEKNKTDDLSMSKKAQRFGSVPRTTWIEHKKGYENLHLSPKVLQHGPLFIIYLQNFFTSNSHHVSRVAAAAASALFSILTQSL
jgi:hypothetical protein